MGPRKNGDSRIEEEEIAGAEEEEEPVDEEASSGDEDDEEEDEDDEDEEDSDGDDDSGGRRRHKAFVPPPPRDALPARTTRGQRMGALQAADEDDADQEFWNQDFFQEEERDDEYATESEPEDRFDADFMQSEGEEEDGEEAEEDARAREPKRKTLRPPGYKRPPAKAHAAAGEAEGEEEEEEVVVRPAPKKRRTSTEADGVLIPAERTVTVRQSTRARVEAAEEERKLQEAIKPRRTVRATVHRQLTQAELLAEAARTEIENAKSLNLLVAIEEESKKKANVKRARYAGPMVRLRSAVTDGEEHTTLEVRNMQTPPELEPKVAPLPPQRATCVVTGAPAKYRDPPTGLAYADLAAYKELQRRKEQALAAQQQQAAAAVAAAAAQQQYYASYQQAHAAW